MDHANVQDVIKNTKEPLLMQNFLKWELLEWDLNQWKEVLGKQPLPFRQGLCVHTNSPQFENTTKIMQLCFDEFLSFIDENPDKWLYFDYKYLKEWFTNINELRKHISWDNFGFPERNVEDSTFWLGSKGAHTPMHVDTYGCNIVAQIYGRKQWILFPPHNNLRRTRVPYEESSIYSNINMFSPCGDEFEGITDCRSIILNPGDVLIVPHRWWHFVENLELAISINMWVDLPIDDDERVNEAIVQMLLSQLINSVQPHQRSAILNQEIQLKDSLMEAIHLTELCRSSKSLDDLEHDFNIKCLKNINIIEPLSNQQFQELVKNQKKSASEAKEVEYLENDTKLLQHYFNAILDEDVISTIKRKLNKDSC